MLVARGDGDLVLVDNKILRSESVQLVRPLNRRIYSDCGGRGIMYEYRHAITLECLIAALERINTAETGYRLVGPTSHPRQPSGPAVTKAWRRGVITSSTTIRIRLVRV